MANVRDVAKYFLSLSEESSPKAITPLKLQKLVYYAQGYHLRDNKGQSLFPEKILAWDHGPVVHQLWEDYKNYRYFTIPKEPFDNSNGKLSKEETASIE